MKKTIFLFLFIAISCSKETGCIEITRKEKSGGNFLFFFGKIKIIAIIPWLMNMVQSHRVQ